MQVYTYMLSISGLFGRNRKFKRDMFDLVEDSEKQLDINELRTILDAKLIALKIKGKANIRVSEQPMKLTREDGFISREFQMFSNRVLLNEEVMGPYKPLTVSNQSTG
jgi:hypothetical protein